MTKTTMTTIPKKASLLRALLLVATVLLGACGDGDSGSPDARVPDGAPGPDSPVPDGGPGPDARPDGGGQTPDGGPDASTPFVCDPVHQTGCGAGQKCDLAASGTFACVADGTLEDFEVCSPTQPNACVAGTTCRSTTFGDNRCAPLCDPAEDTCRSSEPCTSTRTTSDGHTYRMCAQNNGCNPVSNDCADASKTCAWSQFGAFCLAPGSVADGGTCQSAASCQRGSACLQVAGGMKCFKVCDPAGGAPSCGTGITCTQVTTVGPQPMGACGF